MPNIMAIGYGVAVIALAFLAYVQDKRLEKLEKLWAELVPADDFAGHE